MISREREKVERAHLNAFLTSPDGRDTLGVRTVKQAFGVFRVLSAGVCTFESCCFIRSPRWLNKHKSQSKIIPLAGLSPAQPIALPETTHSGKKCKSHTEVIVSHFPRIYLLNSKFFFRSNSESCLPFCAQKLINFFEILTSTIYQKVSLMCLLYIIFKIDQVELQNVSSNKRGVFSI